MKTFKELVEKIVDPEVLGVSQVRKKLFHATLSRDAALKIKAQGLIPSIPTRYNVYRNTPAVYLVQGVSQAVKIAQRMHELNSKDPSPKFIYVVEVDSSKLDKKKFFIDQSGTSFNAIMYRDKIPVEAIVNVRILKNIKYKKYTDEGMI